MWQVASSKSTASIGIYISLIRKRKHNKTRIMLPFGLQGSACSFFVNENNEDLISLKIARFMSNYQSIGLMSPLNKPILNKSDTQDNKVS